MIQKSKSEIISQNMFDLLSETSVRNNLIKKYDIKNFESFDSHKKIELINKISLAIPFDYSTLLYLFGRNLVSEMNVFDSFYKSISEEPLTTIERFASNGTGASCLAGAIITSEIYKKIGYESCICIASKLENNSKINLENMTNIHFALIVKDEKIKYYIDNSLNISCPINIAEGKSKNSLLPVEIVDKGRIIDVNVNFRHENKYLWSILVDEEKKDTAYFSMLMAKILNPEKREDPLQYLRANTLIDGKKAAHIFKDANRGMFRIKFAYNKKERKYFVQISNGKEISIKYYDLTHDNSNFNSLKIQKTAEIREDLERSAGIHLNEYFFEELNTLNKALYVRKLKGDKK